MQQPASFDIALDSDNLHAGKNSCELVVLSAKRNHIISGKDIDTIRLWLNRFDDDDDFKLIVAMLGWAALEQRLPESMDVLFMIHIKRHDIRTNFHRLCGVVDSLGSSPVRHYLTVLILRIQKLLEYSNKASHVENIKESDSTQ
ncbi:hypothetical protein KJ652_05275 [Patescibacteria group bacterium]|nr:hypothetical protein [Patescibacteria group bacterium]MBU1123975.1 hypothetical protein [Patescibacteria group bacterium]MBU1911830.1 hypothetical protein [Patescibacteria group bacterium]